MRLHMTILTEELTEDKSKAILKLEEDQKKKFFRGVSVKWVTNDFKRANILKATDPEKAVSNEKDIFKICGYDPSNAS